ncbi:MAG: 50S ribosomal protein L11 methyltransferase [Acidobacteriota bacterium]
MSRMFAALDLIWPHEPEEDEVDLALAHLDDCGATAIERTAAGARLFFASEQDRDLAMTCAAALGGLRVEGLMVPDEGWAERSQASITAVRINRIIVTPPWIATVPAPGDIVIVIQPSMGFGTGHHASTRLCLGLLQQIELDRTSVLDVGTGSGVLAIAAHRLGATIALGIDYDADALTSAEENIDLNGVRAAVATRPVDIARDPATGGYDVMTANLTGGMLMKYAARLVAELRPGGALIVSGFQTGERDEVVAAFIAAGAAFDTELTEEDWVAGLFRLGPENVEPAPPRSTPTASTEP